MSEFLELLELLLRGLLWVAFALKRRPGAVPDTTGNQEIGRLYCLYAPASSEFLAFAQIPDRCFR